MTRYAILSDIHGNLPALEAVLADIDTRQTNALFYLGDAVGYGPDSSEVIALLTEHVTRLPCVADGFSPREQPIWLAGNHEYGLLGKVGLDLFSNDARRTLERTRARLTNDQRRLLHQRPRRIEIELGAGLRATLVHAAPSDPVGTNRYIDSTESAATEIADVNGQLAFVGHTHYPRVFYETDVQVSNRTIWDKVEFANSNTFTSTGLRCILNPGSVGQPRDGDPRAAYGLLDVRRGSFTFTVHRVEYGVGKTQQRLRKWIGDILPNIDDPGGLAGRLATGH